MADSDDTYPVRLNIEYTEKLDRLTTFFRLILIIPIWLIVTLITASDLGAIGLDQPNALPYGWNILQGIFLATVLMIVFRRKYPRWWFDFSVGVTKFLGRIYSYLFLLTDKYPSTDEEQCYHLEVDYPNVEEDLNRWLPMIKWALAIPHYIVLFFLIIAATIAAIISWFVILFTGKYPKELFYFIVGVMRWSVRVFGYAILLVTDKYPPFRISS